MALLTSIVFELNKISLASEWQTDLSYLGQDPWEKCSQTRSQTRLTLY